MTLPAPVANYTTNMGGVDLADQHSAYYQVRRSSELLILVASTDCDGQCIPRLESHQQACTMLQEGNHQLLSGSSGSLCQGNAAHKHDSRQAISQAGVCAAEPVSHTTQQTVSGCMTCSVHFCKGPCFQNFTRNWQALPSKYACVQLLVRLRLCFFWTDVSRSAKLYQSKM